ncbi:hypothetical protein [Nesterenkonia ebinurensis]|uniref:hypothetical protein n=1 Tax=Nesterenkonia ebinurensis TaxID=2608252 RepID=UPI00123DAE4F|nr:hypothetical protein [Nesterenkonia ebinurensis]
MRRFENDEYLAYIDYDPRTHRDVFVVVVRGKLPDGARFHMLEDFRETYREARALVKKTTGL